MKNNKKKITILDISFGHICIYYLILILFIPTCIYVVYSISGMSIHFLPSSPTNVAMYLGTMIGGLATILAIFLTIYTEEKRRKEEKKSNARVFIGVELNIMHPDFDSFQEYSRNADISKVYYFHEWLSDKDRELPWVTQPENKDPTQRNRIASFIIANPADRPIYDICINVDADIVPIDNNKFVEDQSIPKKYDPINFTVLQQQSKIAFMLPVFKKKQYIAKFIKITYITQMNEQMRYEYECSRSDGSVTEKYYANDEELFCYDKKPSPFYDLRRWDR